MLKNKSVLIQLGGLGLCAAACSVAPIAGALGMVTVAALGSDIAKGAGGIAGHIFGDIFARYADWKGEQHRDKSAAVKNHNLRELVHESIKTVLLSVRTHGGLSAGGRALLDEYIKQIDQRLLDVAIDTRYEGIWEQSVAGYFKTRLEDFAGVKALTPEFWMHFLEKDFDPETKEIEAYTPTPDQFAALTIAGNALYEELPKHLVGLYRDALEHHPEIYVAVQTAILQEIWNGVSRVESKVGKAEQSIRSEIRELTAAIAKAHPVQMHAYVKAFAATAGEFRTVLSDITSLLREMHADIQELLRRDNARSSDILLTPEQMRQHIALYLDWLIKHTELIELRGIKHGGTQVIQLDLKDAYVPLQAKRLENNELAVELRDPHQQLHLIRSKQAAKSNDDVPMEKLLGEGNRLAITGGAGSGKTTVLRYIAWRLATALRGGEALSGASRLGLASGVALPMPILVSFASFARYLRDLPGHAPGNLESFLLHDLVRNEAKFELSPGFFKQLLKQGQDVILLLDGLDEVADAHEREKMRDWVSRFAGDRAALRVVATCRTVAYYNDAALAQFKEIAVQPLDMEKHIAPMVRQAYACINVDQRETRITQLLSGIKQLEANRRASPGFYDKALIDSPLMVRLMLIVQMNNRELPDERAELFDRAVDALFQVEYGVEVDNKKEIARNWERYRGMAQHLAFHLHQQGEDQGREIEEPVLRQVLHKESDFKPHIDDFLRLVRSRGGVVEVRGDKFLFMHHAFQEFLVARYLRSEMYGDHGRQGVLNYLMQYLADPWWREVILLTAEYQTSQSPSEARKLIGGLALMDDPLNARFSAAELAATAALEWHDSGPEIKALCAERIVALLKELDDDSALQNSQPVARARAGHALSRLGDPRFDPSSYYLPAKDPLFGFALIPEDKNFIIGTRGKHQASVAMMAGVKPSEIADEINDQPTPTREFYIARYPVTVAQFRASGLKPRNQDAFNGADNSPVCYVSWNEAMGYCEWLQRQFTVVPALKNSAIGQRLQTRGWCITLPSELEWEKAARGRLIDEVFPWRGKADTNRANYYHDKGIKGISAVGCFPPNGYGLYDMAGNVWEWTRSPYAKYPPQAEDKPVDRADDKTRRVLRGGAWDSDAELARCAVRFRVAPDGRHDLIGFRVVLRSPLL